MNALTGAGVVAEDKLFSTLDTRTRQWHIRDWGRVLLSDTVGFIRDLPHHLVASFRATLEEARQARLLLHVVDASSPHAEEQIAAVQKVLVDLGIADKRVLLVLNKSDQVSDPTALTILRQNHPQAVVISARTGAGFEALREAVVSELEADFADSEVVTSQANGKVIAYLRAHAEIYRQEYRGEQVIFHCYLPRHLLHHIQGPDVQVRFRDGLVPPSSEHAS
jgi:GTP-binding protein HflX